MDFQEQYDELDNITRKLRNLIEDIKDNSYIEELRVTLYRAEEEKQVIEEKLAEQYEEEEMRQEQEYIRSVI